LKKYHGDNVQILKEEIAYNGVSVIIAQRECIQTATKKSREARKDVHQGKQQHKNEIQ
jgi:indolepyruvate ferredoxin oxidoreductase alpha subunit